MNFIYEFIIMPKITWIIINRERNRISERFKEILHLGEKIVIQTESLKDDGTSKLITDHCLLV